MHGAHSMTRGQQRGSVLIVSLIMLLLLTILAVSSMSSTTMQERMAYNTHESTRAFAASESGLREGEFWIGRPQLTVRPVAQPNTTCVGATPRCQVWNQSPSGASAPGPWLAGTGITRYQTLAWWGDNAVIYNSDGDGADLPIVATQPAYVIEYLTNPPPQNVSGSLKPSTTDPYRYFYQVSSRGVGRATVSEVVMQTVYARIF